MPTPIIDRIEQRLNNNHPIIAAVVRTGVEAAAARLDTKMTPADVPAVTAEVAKEVGPVLDNMQNKEKWYESRVKVGLLITGVAFIAHKLGVDVAFDAGDTQFLTDFIMAFGTVIAGAGRWFSTRPPINWRHPWTILAGR